MCRRRVHGGEEYVLLRPAQDVDVEELQSFLRDNFEGLGIRAIDLTSFSKDSEMTRHLIKLLPVYRQCTAKHAFLKQFLQNQCKPHMRVAAEIECEKSKRILDTLDVMILKLVIGEFSLSSEDGSLERLLEKFSADQTTLCELERIERLVSMDRKESRRLMETEAAAEVLEEDVLHRLDGIPSIPQEVLDPIVRQPPAPLSRVSSEESEPPSRLLVTVPEIHRPLPV